MKFSPSLLAAAALLAIGSPSGLLAQTPAIAHQAYIKAHNPDASDAFGGAVAVSGNTVVIAAKQEGSGATGVNGDSADNSRTNAGAVYVFVRTGNQWAQQAYLKASNTDIGDRFGTSVAISGDTIVVGAPNEDSAAIGVNGDGTGNTASNSGAAYVFVRSGSTWTQQAYLKASNTASGDLFGTAVGIAGDTIVVGAPFKLNRTGAAYAFVRTGTTWTQQAYLTASNGEFNDDFGAAVAVSGERALIGAPGEKSNATGINGDQSNNDASFSGAAYMFMRSASVWTQQAYMKASNTGSHDSFGSSLALDGNAAVVGAPFEDSNAAGVNGSQTSNSAPDSGAAYVFFSANGTSWTQRAYLKATNTETLDKFGVSVAISGGTVVVSADGEDGSARGVNGNQTTNSTLASGAAYVYISDGSTTAPLWSSHAFLKASNTGADDLFGTAVAISDNTITVGAIGEASAASGINAYPLDNSKPGAGAAYIFGEALPAAPEIDVHLPFGGPLIASGGTAARIVAPVSKATDATGAIINFGTGALTGLSATIDGPDAASFTVTQQPAASVAASGSTVFVVRFLPSTAGPKTATLHIASNDADENPFHIVLNGLSLSYTEDRDNDGLNDATEFEMSALGFNFEASQTSLVATLFNHSNGAGLYTADQVQALHVDTPLISKDPGSGLFKLTIGVQKSTNLIDYAPLPMSSAQTVINSGGELEFQFTAPDNAAFFRLEAR